MDDELAKVISTLHRIDSRVNFKFIFYFKKNLGGSKKMAIFSKVREKDVTKAIVSEFARRISGICGKRCYNSWSRS